MEINKKLELKHLAPYLPYSLKLENGSVMTPNNIGLACCGYVGKLTPILRPLSDLTNEIGLYADGEFIIGGERIREWHDLNPDRCTYEQITYLFEHHYDVFGLIEKGLAIDINTL